MDERIVKKILAVYGIRNARLLSVERGYRNQSHHVVTGEGAHLNFILYKGEQDIVHRIRRANTVSNHLAHQGLPARRTYKDERILQVTNARYGALYEYLDGATIPWEAYTQQHLKQLGKTMSDMHASLVSVRSYQSSHVADEYMLICERMRAYFSEPGVQHALQKKLSIACNPDIFIHCLKLLSACKILPGQQPLHMDFVRGNILFAAGTKATLTGILDFEKTAVGHPLFDIARTLAFLLVDCKYKDTAKVYKYFVISGYNKRGSGQFKVNAGTEKLLQKLVYLFLIYDFYKFLRHNPYESLHQNEHYRRTVQMLAGRLMNGPGLLTVV